MEPDLACGECGPIMQSIESERLVRLKSMKVEEEFLASFHFDFHSIFNKFPFLNRLPQKFAFRWTDT